MSPTFEFYSLKQGIDWQQFVRNKLNGWEEMNLDWAKNFTGDLKIVFYDDLVRDVEGTLRDILHFINYKIDELLHACMHEGDKEN
uniref:Sulfotransferase domain-containing protein n=1 Tax=Megaselia scalaris TaxID=36166 RepID=T1GCI8_MEGSC